VLQYDDMMDFYYQISYDPHGPVHVLTGGIYGCDLLDTLVDGGYITDRNYMCGFWGFILKELFRAGHITPNSGCTPSAVLEESSCGFTLAGTSSEVWTTIKSMSPDAVNTKLSDAADVFTAFIVDGGDGGRIFSGDHLESASPSDPSFWVIHPTMERLLHAKLLAGGFDTANWASSAGDYVCNKATCYDMDTDSFTTTDCCYGHYESDQMYDGLKGDMSTYGPTNKETQDQTDASSAETYTMPYIYDSFSWSHCEEDFEGLLSDMYNDKLNSATNSGLKKTVIKKVGRPASQDKVREEKKSYVKMSAELLKSKGKK